MLSRFERLAYRWFGRLGAASAERSPHVAMALQRAHILKRPEVYVASIILAALLSALLAMLPLVAAMTAQALGVLQVPLRFYVLLVPAPFVLAMMVYLLGLFLPDLRAGGRGREINAKLPYALNYISTMASAGATPEQIFTSLSQQNIYGAVAQESSMISRDLNVLGTDIVTALGRAIDRSPSVRFQDLLQGAITTLTSGADLKEYFVSKADQYLYENRSDQKKFLESLGVLAESFVTVVVAGPLFIIVILSVMTSFGTSARDTLLIGYALVFLLIPLAQAGFAWTVKVITPEA